MALCSCDGPPHTYDPSWCGPSRTPTRGEPGGTRTPMVPARPWGRDTLAAPRGSDRALRYEAIRRLDDGSEGARQALHVLGVADDEFGRW